MLEAVRRMVVESMHQSENGSKLNKIWPQIPRHTPPLIPKTNAVARTDRLYCPICGQFAPSFNEYGLIRRPDAQCPTCRSLERHRLAWAFFVRFTNLKRIQDGLMLHVAPESCMEAKFRSLKSIQYMSADLSSHRAMVKMDLTHMAYPNRTFDIIYCSHVLEHIVDEQSALNELYRVLKNGGWAVIQVPTIAAATYEDNAVTAPADRTRIFGQHDHVRNYGPDFGQRLTGVGFNVIHIMAADVVTPTEMQVTAIRSHHDLFYCIRDG